jgi:acylphosphatase
MDAKRIHIIVTGTVQGVFFRESTREMASREGVVGWVKNLPDGTVEAVLEGSEPAVERLLAFIRANPGRSTVSEVRILHERIEGAFESFTILR